MKTSITFNVSEELYDKMKIHLENEKEGNNEKTQTDFILNLVLDVVRGEKKLKDLMKCKKTGGKRIKAVTMRVEEDLYESFKAKIKEQNPAAKPASVLNMLIDYELNKKGTKEYNRMQALAIKENNFFVEDEEISHVLYGLKNYNHDGELIYEEYFIKLFKMAEDKEFCELYNNAYAVKYLEVFALHNEKIGTGEEQKNV